MTSKEFVIWLRGFVAGSNNFNLTPAGWDTLKDELEKVDDLECTPIGSGFGFPNFTPAPLSPSWQHPHYPNPMDNPYKITFQPDSNGTTIHTASGSNGFIITTNQNTTSTTYGYPSGSAWHYTNEGIK